MISKAFVLILLLSTVYCKPAAEDTKNMVERVIKQCMEKNNVEMKDIETAIKERKLPEDEKGKKFLTCIIKEVGFQQMRHLLTHS